MIKPCEVKYKNSTFLSAKQREKVKFSVEQISLAVSAGVEFGFLWRANYISPVQSICHVLTNNNMA